MSIYESRRNRALNDDPAWERIMLVGSNVRPDPPPGQSVQGGARLRKATPANYLLPASIDWLRSLPREMRPTALATKFARIVNLLAQQWNDDAACYAYFDTLLADRRGNRRGFPADVRSDIRMLQEYFVASRQKAARGMAIVA